MVTNILFCLIKTCPKSMVPRLQFSRYRFQWEVSCGGFQWTSIYCLNIKQQKPVGITNETPWTRLSACGKWHSHFLPAATVLSLPKAYKTKENKTWKFSLKSHPPPQQSELALEQSCVSLSVSSFHVQEPEETQTPQRVAHKPLHCGCFLESACSALSSLKCHWGERLASVGMESKGPEGRLHACVFSTTHPNSSLPLSLCV